MLDGQGGLVEANATFLSWLHLDPEAYRGSKLAGISPELAAISEHAEAVTRTLPGPDRRPHLYRVLPLPRSSGPNRVLMAVDLGPPPSSPEMDQNRLYRLNRLHALLSRTNEVIIRATEPSELYHEACRIAVEEGHLQMAWIGGLDHETGHLRPLARFGPDDGYIDAITLSVHSGPTAQGPTGRAFRTGMYSYTNDIPADTSFHYRKEAAARGFLSCALFPLFHDGRVEAILVVYARERHFFQTEELEVLSALADDISFAIDAIGREKKRRKAETLLQNSERRLSTLLSNLPGIAYRCRLDAEWTVEFISEGCRILTGYEAADLLQNHRLSFKDLIHPDDQLRVASAVRQAVEAGEPFELTYRLIRADGEERWVWERGVAVHDDELWLEGFMTDITAQREAQVRIRRQAELLNKASDAIVVCSVTGEVEYWNRGAEQIYGWLTYEVLGKSLTELLQMNMERRQEAIDCVMREGDWAGELKMKRKNGTSVTVRSRWTLIRGTEGAPDAVLHMDTDISEQKKLEEQILRSQRLESIGALAGGIAHDLNNVLAPILISLDLLRSGMRTDGERQLLQTVEKSAHRGAQMVRQILSFARGLEAERVEMDPCELLKDIRILTRETLPRTIEVVIDSEPNLPLIRVNPTQLNQVLLNLCVNARDAMPQGGRLGLRASEQTYEISTERPHGQYVVLEVSDTGVGMEKNLLNSIFEPFFTTKARGQGTGLGLSTTRSIVRNHQGFMEVTSEPGKGSTFKVALPSLGHRRFTVTSPPQETLTEGNGETILVIEDEASILSIVQQVLETFGYKVIIATHGQDGVLLYQDRFQEIDLVISDMMMPVLDGPKVIAHLREINPEVRIVAISGLPKEDIFMETRIHPDELAGFLPKPFSADVLLSTVASALGK